MAVVRLKTEAVRAARANRKKPMALQIVEKSSDPTTPTAPATPVPVMMSAPEPTTDQTAILAQTLGIISAIAALTAVRLLLLLAVVGAFYIAVIAAMSPAMGPLWVLIAYAVLIVLPLVWLDSNKRLRA
jgi:hypothetical protein